MYSNRPTLLITGASGFIGSYLVNHIKDSYNIYALCRRRPKNFDFENHPAIYWLPGDVGQPDSISKALARVDKNYPVEYIIHLAGFYDFNYDNNPEYERTNVEGTRNILQAARSLKIKRFIFASSVAACDYPRGSGRPITEQTPADATFAYAVSKRKGEALVKEFSRYFPCSVVRFAAAFSDWCEYGPLYIFLRTWLTRNWKSRVLGGRGKSAIPYIHVNCLINLLLTVVEKSQSLPAFDTYIAGDSPSASHKELYDLASRFFYGRRRKPFYAPKPLAALGIFSMDLMGRLLGKRPFERAWMIRYIDKEMKVDSTYTQQTLGWKPTRRYVIQRRLLFMIEHMKSYPYEWQKRNDVALKQKRLSPNFMIYESLDKLRDQIIAKCLEHILSPDHYDDFKGYHTVDKAVLKKDTATLYQFLSVAVRSKDRMSVIQYAREIALIRSKQQFDPEEVIRAVSAIGNIIYEELIKQEALKKMRQEVYDEINLTFQLVIDEIEGTFEFLNRSQKKVPAPA